MQTASASKHCVYSITDLWVLQWNPSVFVASLQKIDNILRGRDVSERTAHRPGEQAPVTGMYVLLDPEGTATTVRVPTFQGAACPVAPHGWMWQLDPGAAVPAD
ncbi:MAG: hypothetical protein ABSC95_32020 [Acetobacteraceae bacterium]